MGVIVCGHRQQQYQIISYFIISNLAFNLTASEIRLVAISDQQVSCFNDVNFTRIRTGARAYSINKSKTGETIPKTWSRGH